MQNNMTRASMNPFLRASGLAAASLIMLVTGCAPSNDATPRGEVVEVEVIETAPPAADPARNTPVADESAMAAKKADAQSRRQANRSKSRRPHRPRRLPVAHGNR